MTRGKQPTHDDGSHAAAPEDDRISDSLTRNLRLNATFTQAHTLPIS